MINRITIKMPLPIRLGAFFFNWKKQVGFSFDNQSMFNFRENNGFKNESTEKDLLEWHNQHGRDRYFLEMLYGAHESYCTHNMKKAISKTKLMRGIESCDEAMITELAEMWQRSLKFGHADLPGKKKAKVKA